MNVSFVHIFLQYSDAKVAIATKYGFGPYYRYENYMFKDNFVLLHINISDMLKLMKIYD